jgi:ATP-dependent exoDNAse (exonuclease V) beta subunit
LGRLLQAQKDQWPQEGLMHWLTSSKLEGAPCISLQEFVVTDTSNAIDNFVSPAQDLLVPAAPISQTKLRFVTPSWLSFSQLTRHSSSPSQAPRLPSMFAETTQTGNSVQLRGPIFGDAFHWLIEQALVVNAADHRVLSAMALEKFNLPATDQSLHELLLRTLATNVGEQGPLSRWPVNQRWLELEFLLPQGTNNLAVLDAIARQFGRSMVLPNETVRGWFNGKLDLLCRTGQRYYLIDFKTNDLGTDDGAYHHPALDAAVNAGGYGLQLLLYQAALLRQLRARGDANADIELQVWFVRGLRPGADDGIWRWRAPLTLLAAVDDWLAGVSP